MEDQRHARWIHSSLALAGIDQFMPVLAQQLGRLDAKLIFQDQQFSDASPADRESLEQAFSLDERFTLSYLWVLGSFELLRTLHERIKQNKQFTPAIRKKLESVKKQFARLRSPLAKWKTTNSERTVAFPAMHSQLGISWQIDAATFVSRRELSDSLLDLLEDMRRVSDKNNPNTNP